MRVIGYIRVSTEEQAKEGISLAAQREKVALYCRLHSLELVSIEADAGESAKTLKRPGLIRALAALKAGKAEGIVITKLDRLTRCLRDWDALIENYFGEKAGCRLMSVADSIDTRTASGRMVLNVVMTMAQWERETIAERTRDALRFKRSQGKSAGRMLFGFDLAPDGKTLVPNVAEQEAVTRIFAWKDEGWSLRRIAAELDRLGVKPKRGAGRWAHTAVKSILERATTAAA
jgi:DNA invertase Pin-like site-specific DNA recombinase